MISDDLDDELSYVSSEQLEELKGRYQEYEDLGLDYQGCIKKVVPGGAIPYSDLCVYNDGKFSHPSFAEALAFNLYDPSDDTDAWGDVPAKEILKPKEKPIFPEVYFKGCEIHTKWEKGYPGPGEWYWEIKGVCGTERLDFDSKSAPTSAPTNSALYKVYEPMLIEAAKSKLIFKTPTEAGDTCKVKNLAAKLKWLLRFDR
jgi:hypothetical protein